jgi:IS30 family transposase
VATKADKISELLRDGLSTAEVAEMVDVAPSYVRAVRSVRQLGRPEALRLTPEERAARLEERYQQQRRRARERYQTDPEYRAKVIEGVKRYQRRLKELGR